MNPFANSPLAINKNSLRAWNFFIKFFLPIYPVLFPDGKYSSVMIGMVAFYYFLMVLIRLRITPFNDATVENLSCLFEVSLYWISTSVFIQSLLPHRGDVDNLGALYCGVGLLINIGLFWTWNMEKISSFLEVNLFKCESEDSFINYCYAFVHLNKKCDQKSELIQLHYGLKRCYEYSLAEEVELDPCVRMSIAKSNIFYFKKKEIPF